jgi:prepilin-type N-terminal cleavage/methylation domain-containing protein
VSMTRRTASAALAQRNAGGTGNAGFTLVELLVSMTLSLVIVGAALVASVNARRANETAALLLEMNGGLRAATDLIVRDLIQVGQGLPAGKVIEKPNGAGSAAVRRPGPPAANLTFPAADLVFSAVTIGPGLGPAFTEPAVGGGAINGPATDIITVIYVDSVFDGVPCTIAANGRSVTVSNNIAAGGALISGVGVNDPMLAGDLVLLTGSTAATGSALLEVTGVAGQVITFGAPDPMNLNQVAGTDGTVMQLLPTPAAATTAVYSRVRMLTYYVDTTTEPPRLMRQINYNAPRAVAVGIDNLQLSYDIADGINNPTNVKAPANPNQIRKVNLYLSARSRTRARSGQFLRNSLATQIALRSLAFVDRYQ